VGRGAKDLLVGCVVLLAGLAVLLIVAMVVLPGPESIHSRRSSVAWRY
jgi:hypothetical protein